MEVIGKTKGGVIITATEKEIKQILSAVNGEPPKDIEIGQRIPAIDYSSTITKVKALAQNYSFRQMVSYKGDFDAYFEELVKEIEGVRNLDPQ